MLDVKLKKVGELAAKQKKLREREEKKEEERRENKAKKWEIQEKKEKKKTEKAARKKRNAGVGDNDNSWKVRWREYSPSDDENLPRVV